MANPINFPSREALMRGAAERLAEALGEALSEHGDACAALSGGTTPEPAYKLLAQIPLDWPRLTFALVDERFVPPTHGASNENMLRRALAPALAQGATLAAMYAPAKSLEEAAALADARYAPLRIDIALMGMGLDGHTASWFADAEGLPDALDEQSARAVAAARAPQAAGSAERLTLTKAALLRAGRVELLITGHDKMSALEAAYAARPWAPATELFSLPSFTVLWAP